jgi:hypothetical protein
MKSLKKKNINKFCTLKKKCQKIAEEFLLKYPYKRKSSKIIELIPNTSALFKAAEFRKYRPNIIPMMDKEMPWRHHILCIFQPSFDFSRNSNGDYVESNLEKLNIKNVKEKIKKLVKYQPGMEYSDIYISPYLLNHPENLASEAKRLLKFFKDLNNEDAEEMINNFKHHSSHTGEIDEICFSISYLSKNNFLGKNKLTLNDVNYGTNIMELAYLTALN